MTQTNILERKKQKLESQKHRLKQIESHVKSEERKARTRRLIELGGLVTKADLDQMESNVLLGAFLEIKERLSDVPDTHMTNIKEAWAKKGGVAFNKEQSTKVPVIISFTDKPTSEMRDTLKDLGLKWNPIRKEWEGYVQQQKLQTQSFKNDKNMQIRILDRDEKAGHST
jgi:hypothetical protein